MTRHERLYRRLLRLYPDDFRERYGAEMTRLFGDQLRDADASGDPVAVASLWVRSILDLLATAPGHHVRRERHVPQPVDIRPGSLAPEGRGADDPAPRVLLGLLPLWILVFLLVAAPGFMDPVFDAGVTVAGIPAGMVVVVIGLIVMVVGVQILRRTSSWTSALLAFLCLTAPSTIVVVLAPAMILIVQNT
jgi:hypothetical protein